MVSVLNTFVIKEGEMHTVEDVRDLHTVHIVISHIQDYCKQLE